MRVLAKAPLKALSFPVNLVGERDDSHAPLAPSEQGWFETALNEYRICRIDRHKRVATVKIEMPDRTAFAKGLKRTEKG